MNNNKLTDEQLNQLNESFYIINDKSAVGDDDYKLSEMAMMAIAELQEYRKAATPELKPAHLINKFYERYQLAGFKTDSERSEALGYFMAGAELQCFGEFIKYEDMCGDD